MSVRYLDCGDTAFSVEFGATIAPEINARVMGLHARIAAERAAGRLAGVVETTPSMRALMVCYDPAATTRAELQPAIEALVSGGLEAAAPTRTMAIPCCYDDPEFAPDLAEVAQRTGVSGEDVIARHLASDFHVYVLGFMPGLAYIVGLEASLELPRRSQPRVRVPRSSVGIAMNMTTIYPFDSPGGWHLLGRTPLRMFDQRRAQPVLLAPGDAVRFRRVSRAEYDAIAAQVDDGTLDWSTLEVRPS
ncbi:5-oxoprolinase subunit PxpB [Vineibacter terrae]|uniref:5-oxoprolinase subunit PxpB n=1 Tax=Vineibacter terrae TaxID=2586908 RepID=UPI002E359F4A|nr:5-oxoprolinase subunit PxpB [Vineibacter terrae]HEX2885894.1 5-oxoprolinase subunit PxpB [Vineibacter terrae]